MEFEKAMKIADSHDSGSDFCRTVRKALEKQIVNEIKTVSHTMANGDVYTFGVCPKC